LLDNETKDIPMSYKIEWIGNNAHVFFEGDIDFDELNKANGELYGDARFDLMDYAIFDLINAREFNITEHEMLMISALDKSASRWNEKLKLACISEDKNEKVKQMLEHYVHLMKDNKWTIKLFSNLSEAVKWCNN